MTPLDDQGHHTQASDAVVIPHGDYTPWLAQMAVDDTSIQMANAQNASRNCVHFLCFGVIKRYKNIHEPVEAIVGCGLQNVHLSVKGMAPDTEYLAYLQEVSAADSRVQIIPGRLEDEELVREILAADVVLLPYPDLYNSGVLLMALSLGRPVALRNSTVARDFQREFGPDWIVTYDGELSSSVVEQLAHARRMPKEIRFVSNKRDWASIGEQHNHAYSLLTD